MPTDPPFGHFTRSVLTFPWAISLLGIQQLANLVGAPSGEKMTAATRAFDAMTRATREPVGGWREQGWQAARTLRRAVIELTRARPRSIDSSMLTSVAAHPRLAPLVADVAGYAVPPLAWLDSFRVASGDSSALLREVANKLRIMQAAADACSRLRVDEAAEEPLRRPLERAADLDPFVRLWAVEALGAWYGGRALARANGREPEAVLTDTAASAVPSWSLLMLHAGLGRSFAGDVLARLEPASSPAAVRTALSEFIRLCRRCSRRGYAGAAFGSLGFAARAFREPLMRLLDREIAQVDPGLLGYFWHGAGRAMYFAPSNLLPSANAPSSAIVDLERETPHELAYRDALSGFAWAMTLANLQDPDVVEVFLQYDGDLGAGSDAFSNGVSSAVVVRSLTTPGDPAVTFVDYEPRSGAAGAAAWRSLVAIPCRAALDRRSRESQHPGAPEELFRYRPTPA